MKNTSIEAAREIYVYLVKQGVFLREDQAEELAKIVEAALDSENDKDLVNLPNP